MVSGCLYSLPDIPNFLPFFHYQFCLIFITVLGTVFCLFFITVFSQCKIWIVQNLDTETNLSQQQKATAKGAQDMNPGYDIFIHQNRRKPNIQHSEKTLILSNIAIQNTFLIAVLQAARESGDSRVSCVCSGDYD